MPESGPPTRRGSRPAYSLPIAQLCRESVSFDIVPDPSNCCCASRSGLVVSSQRIGVGPWNHIRRSMHSAATPGEEKDLEIGWPVLAKVYRLSSRDHRCLAGIERNVLLCFVSTLSEISAGVGSTFHYVRQRARASETQHE